MNLTGKQRKYLRGLAHGLDPVVIVGVKGVSASVVRQVDQALTDHELIKVRIGNECPVDEDEAGRMLALHTECEVAGSIGHVLILYRPRAENPSIRLPGVDAGETE